ncbi:MAG: hypothetical protein SFV54_05240 [Bryobacteraceae bacterium]|nr:hypothetical protein [Bryobacteraceae bacterium]
MGPQSGMFADRDRGLLTGRAGGFEGLFFFVIKGGEEVEAGAGFDVVDGGEEVGEGGFGGGGVGDDGGEHGALVVANREDGFEEMGGDGDAAFADGGG